MSKIIIVDEKDNQIALKERDTLESEDIYRVSALWIINSKEELLLAQRKLSKRLDPGRWGPSAAGTVEENETYDSNMLKEAEEEIGLKNFKFKKGPKIRIFRTEGQSYFCQIYILSLDWPISNFKIAEDEVEQIKWVSTQAIIADVKKNPQKYTLTLRYIEEHLNLIKSL